MVICPTLTISSGGGNGPCGAPICYKCTGTTCVNDNVNGTYTSCTPNPCTGGGEILGIQVIQGQGTVTLYKNGTSIGSVSQLDGKKTFTFVIGDIAKFDFSPSSGYIFEKLCTPVGTFCTTSNPYQFTIAGGYDFQASFKTVTTHLGCNSTTLKCETKSGGGGNTEGCTSIDQSCIGGGGGVGWWDGKTCITPTMCITNKNMVIYAGIGIAALSLLKR